MCSILAGSESVYSFPHILPAEMRIVMSEGSEDRDQKNRNVSPRIGPIKVRSRTRLGSGKYDRQPVPTVRSVIHRAAHRSPQPFGAIHLVVVQSDAAGGQQTGLDRPQDRGADEGGVRWGT